MSLDAAIATARTTLERTADLLAAWSKDLPALQVLEGGRRDLAGADGLIREELWHSAQAARAGLASLPDPTPAHEVQAEIAAARAKVEELVEAARRRDADERATARHEAGHAIAALRNDERPFKLYLGLHRHRDGSMSAGRLQRTSPSPRPRFGRLRRRLVMRLRLARLRWLAWRSPEWTRSVDDYLRKYGVGLYAGVAAQMPTLSDWTFDHAFHSEPDRDLVREKSRLFGRPPPPDVDHRLFDQAIELVDREWGALIAITEALLERRELDDAECAELAANAERRRNPWRRPRWESSGEFFVDLNDERPETELLAACPAEGQRSTQGVGALSGPSKDPSVAGTRAPPGSASARTP